MADPLVLVWLAGTAALAGAGELAIRPIVRTRTIALLGRVADATDLDVTLPPGILAPTVLRGRIEHLRVTCSQLILPSLTVNDVSMDLYDLHLDHRLEVRAGHGQLTGHLSADGVLAMAGASGSLHLREGLATLRWPRRTIGGVRIGLRLRPELDGNRVKLPPTPLSIPLPDLPVGVTVTAVTAQDDCLAISADLDLPRLLR